MTIVKNTPKAALFTVLMLSLQAHAIFDPNWERPIESAQLDIIKAEHGFRLVENVEVVLKKRDGSLNPTSFVVNYEKGLGDMLPAFENISEEFFIDEENISKDECGSIYYSASIYQAGDARLTGPRSNATLVDHRQRICDDVVPNLFELHMRKGYGWCGTGDSVLHAAGNPEPLYSAYIK